MPGLHLRPETNRGPPILAARLASGRSRRRASSPFAAPALLEATGCAGLLSSPWSFMHLSQIRTTSILWLTRIGAVNECRNSYEDDEVPSARLSPGSGRHLSTGLRAAATSSRRPT